MKRLIVGLVFLLAWTVMAPPTWAQDDGTADLAVTITWLGTGTPHVQAGGIATWTVTVTNLGPATAQQVEVDAGGSDQFGVFVSSCGAGESCVLGDLAAGDSRTVTFSANACLIQTGHRRVWWVTSSAHSTTMDPDSSNNMASLDVRITGSFGAC
ncbi:MAG TPA: hypothetical protein VF165_04945 [Nocardioidaceae bacterium]